MPKELSNIIIKEVKEMVRDPRILLGMVLAPLIVFPLLGFMFRASTEAVQESLRSISIGVADFDNGGVAKNLTDFLKSNQNVKIETIGTQSVDELVASAQASNLTAVIVIPQDFSKNITNGQRAELKVYGIFRGSGIAESASFSVVQGLLESFKQNLVLETVQTRFPDNPNVVLNPVNFSQGSIVKGKPVDLPPSVLFTFAQTQSLGLPIALFMLVILAMQLAATSVASEKEEKTLETLMSLPLNRFTLLIGKLGGSTIIAAIGAIATIFGVIYYMGSFTFAAAAQPSVDLAAIGLTPGLLGYVILGASVFVSLLCALAIAVVVSVFAEDVRGAQSLLGFVYTPLVLPIFVLMFADINTLPLALRIFLLALPFTHPVLAARATITGDYLTPVLGIAYVTAFTLVILFVAARIFATERILTMRIGFRRKKVIQE